MHRQHLPRLPLKRLRHVSQQGKIASDAVPAAAVPGEYLAELHRRHGRSLENGRRPAQDAETHFHAVNFTQKDRRIRECAHYPRLYHIPY